MPLSIFSLLGGIKVPIKKFTMASNKATIRITCACKIYYKKKYHLSYNALKFPPHKFFIKLDLGINKKILNIFMTALSSS